MAEDTPGSSIGGTTAPSSSNRRRLRRVPENSRKRSAQSCDTCRKRRCKCVPLASGHGCVMCRNQNVECSYRLPRKARFYGSVDDLSDRYKCLEAIVKHAFPDDAIDTVADLVQLGERQGYSMPDLSDTSPEDAVRIEELARTGAFTDRRCSSFNAPVPPNPEAIVQDGSTEKTHEASGTGESLGLIRDTAGREHFIGPSGSLQFLGQLRRLLVSGRSAASGSASRTPAEMAPAFTTEDAAQALETDGSRTEIAGTISSVSPVADGSRGGGQQHNEGPSPYSPFMATEPSNLRTDNPEAIIEQLPPRATLDALLRTYFKHFHADFPLFHRGTFEDEYEAFLARGRHSRANFQQGSAPPVPEPGWLGCLHMMVAFACLVTSSAQLGTDIDLAALCRQCVAFNQQLLRQLVSRCTLSNIRALLLLSLFLHNHNERNAAWNLVGTAIRISFALGLHRAGENGTHFRPMEREVRKRVFCTLYGFEQFLASSLGRPSGFYDFQDVELLPPRESVLGSMQGEDEEMEMTLSLQLQIILARACVSTSIKKPGPGDVSSASNPQEQAALETLESLRVWREKVAWYRLLDIPFITEPSQALGIYCQVTGEGSQASLEELKAALRWQSGPSLRATLVLHVQYRYVAVFVTRSILLRNIASARSEEQRNPHTSQRYASTSGDDLARACVSHAVQLCRLILLADNFGLINGISAMDVFYAYCGVMALILCSLRPAVLLQTSTSVAAETQVLQAELRGLIARTREVLIRANKCSTMARFARVVATFEDGSRPDVLNSDEDVSHSIGQGNTRQSAGDANAARANIDTFSAQRNGRSRVPQPGRDTGAASSAMRPPDTYPQEAQYRQQPFNYPQQGAVLPWPSVEDPYLWQPNLLTSFDGDPETSEWMMDPWLGINEASAVDWGDVDSLLSRFPTQ